MNEQELLIKILDEIRDDIKCIDEKLFVINADVSSLKIKSSIWGGVTGGLISALAYIAMLVGYKK